MAGPFDVRPLAQVDEFALLVEANRRVRYALDQVEFVGLVVEALTRLVSPDL